MAELTYDMRVSLKREVNLAMRSKLGACEECGQFHERRSACVYDIDLSGYPVKLRWERDDLVRFLRLATQTMGRPPRVSEYDRLRGGRRHGDRRMPNSDAIVRRFGTWEAALEAAA